MVFIRYIVILFLMKPVFGIGLKALEVPQTGLLISLSGAGIGSGLAVELNPANIEHKQSCISFSNNKWLGDLSGSKISYLQSKNKFKHYFSFEFLSIDDIELRNDQPSDNPLGYVESNWVAFDYAGNIPNNLDIDLGYKIKLNYSKLYTSRYYGYSFDFGLKKNILNNLDLGFVIKNFGVEYNGSESENIQPTTGVGISYSLNLDKNYFKGFNFLFDVLDVDSQQILRIGAKINFPYVGIHIGSSFSENYRDIAYGLSFKYDNFELIIGNLNHENSILGSPVSLEFSYFLK